MAKVKVRIARRSPITQAICEAARPIDRGPPWQWCEKHVEVDNTSPYPGKWRSANSPFVKELMEVFADNRVSDISVMCSAQSSKTQTLLNCALWAISEDPGPMMWVMAARDEAASFVRTRLLPMVEKCEPAARLLPDDRTSKQTLELNFRTMPLYITGANSPSKLQSKPIRWLILDEVRNYPPGALDMVLKRTRSFWNARRLIISTPDKKDDAVHRAFLAGDQREWHFECPHCKALQSLQLAQLKAQHPETKEVCRWDEVPGAKNGHVWNLDALAPQLRYQCVSCGHLIADTPAERNHIMNAGRWIRMNPTAPSHRVSFHWSALLPKWVKWSSIVEEKINADRALRLGDPEPLKTFVNETLGEVWEDRLKEFDDFGVLRDRVGDYRMGDPLPEGWRPFMAIDVQKDHLRWVARAIGPDGFSTRLIGYGKAANEDDAEAIRISLNVSHRDTCIDTAHDSARTYRICVKYKWRGFRGDDRPFFSGVVIDPVTGEKKTIRKIWALSHADPGIGTKDQGKLKPIQLFLWSNPSVKDMLALAMSGSEQAWTIAADADAEYFRQISAEERVEKTNAKGEVSYEWIQRRRDNHYMDCECMIQTAMYIAKILRRAPGISSEFPDKKAGPTKIKTMLIGPKA